MDSTISGGISARRDSDRPLVLVVKDRAVDFIGAINATGVECDADITLRDVYDSWARWAPTVDAAIELLTTNPAAVDAWSSLADLDLAPPVHPEASLIFTAANYAAHTSEAETSEKVGKKVSTGSDTPYVFLKPMRSVVGPNDNIVKPLGVDQMDWEVELAVVIGKAGRRISVDEASNYIAGYMICNDVSARDYVQRPDWPMFSSDWFAQKAFDTFTPFGPAFVPVSQIPDADALCLRLWVGDELMQDGFAGEMIFSIAEQISYASQFTTLLPGDIISTGTPSGVGMARNRYLSAGELLVAEISGLGQQRSLVVAEEDTLD